MVLQGLSPRPCGSTPLHPRRIHNLKAAYYFCLLLAYAGGEFVHAFQSCLFHWGLYRFTRVYSAMCQYHCNLLRVLWVYLLLLLLVGCGCGGHKSFRATGMAASLWALEGRIYNSEILGTNMAPELSIYLHCLWPSSIQPSSMG